MESQGTLSRPQSIETTLLLETPLSNSSVKYQHTERNHRVTLDSIQVKMLSIHRIDSTLRQISVARGNGKPQ